VTTVQLFNQQRHTTQGAKATTGVRHAFLVSGLSGWSDCFTKQTWVKNKRTTHGWREKQCHRSDGFILPSGNLTSLLKMAIEIVDFPIKDGDFP